MSENSISFSMSYDASPGTAQPEPRIEFLCDPGLAGSIPEPQPAARFLPDWFRDLDREMGMPDAHGMAGLTVKACLPVTDVFTLGFVIPLPYDVRIAVPQDRMHIQLGWDERCAFQPIEQHHPGQLGAPNPPFEGVMPLKFINPWRIKVPDGYSVLFQPVMNRPELPFYCFSGLVDCDRFATTINFPFFWSGAPGEFVLESGTPMIQIVPIRRDALIKAHQARASTEAELAEQANARQRKYSEESTYRREWRVKK
jgi:hypothetical protein